MRIRGNMKCVKLWWIVFTSLWNHIFINRFLLCCAWAQLIKAHLLSVHEIWLALKGMPFFNSQIKVYWRPEWLKVAMATGVKRISVQTCDQWIGIEFLWSKVHSRLKVNLCELKERLQITVTGSIYTGAASKLKRPRARKDELLEKD